MRSALPVLLVFGSVLHADDPTSLPDFSSASILSHATFLAGKELIGRKAGTEHERIAAVYISSRLDAGRVPPPPKKKRLQSFALSAQPKNGDPRSQNVLGWIEGSDLNLKGEVVVLGAHYDHLGETPAGVCLGADDNASGVAVLIEVAAALAANKTGLGRSVLVAFFGAEEIGLVGSRHFVKQPSVPIESIVAMVNVDMIGRPLADQLALKPLLKLAGVDERGIGVVGVKDSPFLRELIETACAQAKVPVFGTKVVPVVSDVVESMAKNRGDHAPFEEKGIPVAFFGSGESDDYHKPTDTIDKLDAKLMASRARALYGTIVLLTKAPREKLAGATRPGESPK